MRPLFRDFFRFFFSILIILCATNEPLKAQSKPPATPAMTQQLIDDVVDAISTAVVEKLKKDGTIATKPTEPAPVTSEPELDIAADRVTAFAAQADVVLRSYPELWRNLTRIPTILDKSQSGGRGLGAFFLLLCMTVAAALGSEAFLGRALESIRRRLAGDKTETPGFWPLVGIACLDALGLAAVWLVSYGFLGIWFRGSDEQARLAAAVVSMIYYWRFYMFVLRIFFRPQLATARLATVDDADAGAIYLRLSAVIAVIMSLRLVFRILTAIKSPPEAISAWLLLTSCLGLGLLLWTAWRLQRPVAAWLSSMINPIKFGNLKLSLARNWLSIAALIFLGFFLTQIYGAITAHFIIPTTLLLTLNLFIALLLFETFLHFITKRTFATAGSVTTSGPRARDVIMRCMRVALYIGVGTAIAQAWIVDVAGFLDSGQWSTRTQAALTVGSAGFLAYVCWQVINFLTDSYIYRNSPAALAPDQEEAAAPPSATRLATILPLLRLAAIIVIIVLATLVMLPELGISIAPFIAAVSIFGLALSFGSQTLVRDIVSGIFYLSDDAFRVGEYITCGSAKGTVEGFTLRSIKLRHQNGQLYTIPFGQLGQVINFSRDWCTMKFNLRFARDTDVEKLRKTTKKVGLAMLEDPEFKNEFLSPLKLQGIADVADNALIMRFKFTSKPNIPTLIQREAMKRLFPAFQAAGIEFASATVSVQTIGGRPDEAAGAAAAAGLKANTSPT